VEIELLFRRGDADDLGGARRQLLEDRVPGAAQKDRRQTLADLVEAAVADHLAALVDRAVALEEAERGAEAALVDDSTIE
jgi:hypothetical protein